MQGLTGAQGIQGTTGIQGTNGIQGITGSQGIQGIQGTQGVIGLQGTQGIGNVETVSYRTSVYSNGTTSPTTVISYTNLANSAVVGETYRLKIWGYRTGTNNSGSTIRVNVDGVTALTYTHASTATAANFMFESFVTIMTTGATGTAWTQGIGWYNAVVAQPTSTATTTISTTTDSIIEITLASGSPSNTYFVTNAIIEMVN